MAKAKHRKLRIELIETCRRMNTEGINQGTSGNVSVRLPDGRPGFLITPSGIPYEAMTADQIVEMDLEGGYFGEFLPSSEWRMHLDIMRNKPEAGAVVHTHSVYSTALSCLRKGIPSFHYMIGVGGGTDIRCTPYAPFGTQELSDYMLSALENRKACLLGNHGMICFGPNLGKALWLAVEVETLAKQYWIASQMGKPVLLGEADMQDILARFRSYGKQMQDLKPGEALAVVPPPRRDAPPAKNGRRK